MMSQWTNWRWIRTASKLMAVVILLVGTIPVWLPWVLPLLLQRLGVQYESSERIGYTRFILRGVLFDTKAVRFRAEKVEFSWPLAWLLRSNDLVVQDWELQFAQQRVAPLGTRTESTFTFLTKLEMATPKIRRWLPRANLINGIIATESQQIQITRIDWADSQILVQGNHPKFKQPVALKADMSVANRIALQLRVDLLGTKLNTVLHRQSDAWMMNGNIMWLDNRVEINGHFGPDGWLPQQVILEGDSLHIPATMVKLDGYNDLVGSLIARWSQSRFDLRVSAFASPLRGDFPPVKLSAHAYGDNTMAVLEKLDIELPWLQAQLLESMRWEWAQTWQGTSVGLTVAIDLAKIPRSSLTGTIYGNVRVLPSDVHYPSFSFELTGESLAINDAPIDHLALSGHLHWPIIEVDRMDLQMTDSLTVHVTAWADLSKRQRIEISQVGARYDCEPSVFEASGKGWINISPELQAAVDIDSFLFEWVGTPLYQLEQSCAITFEKQCVRIDQLHWVGIGGEIEIGGEVVWPHMGNIHTHWRNVLIEPWAELAGVSLQNSEVMDLNFQASWKDSPLVFTLETKTTVGVSNSPPITVQAQLNGDSTGVKIEALHIAQEQVGAVELQGSFPVVVQPTNWPKPLYVFKDDPLNLKVRTEPYDSLWNQPITVMGLRLIDPEVRLDIHGTPREPEGRLHIDAPQIELKLLSTDLIQPKLENLKVEATLHRNLLQLETLHLIIEGQPIHLDGWLPLEKMFWTDLLTKGSMPDWQQAYAKLQIKDAQLASIVQYQPELLSPQGQLNANISYRPGGQFDGTIVISNAATRPLPPLGPIYDIQTSVQFSNSTVIVKTFDGVLGGQKVGITGRAGWNKTGITEVNFKLHGRNVPLARQTGLVLRSDVDLILLQTNGGPFTITGELLLRDSMFVQKIGSLLPSDLAKPKQRPPYFSVEKQPMADWNLDLHIHGERFLRVQLPIFQGNMSAAFRLTGSLREPVAVGEARVADGHVLFPFANLRTDQGLLSLTSENPYRPELYLSGAARTYGYNVTMLIQGSLENPVVTFSSTPPLSSEEIILMLTAGELPRSDLANTQQQRAGRLATFFGRGLLDKLDVEKTMTDRLELRMGEDVTEQSSPTYYLEYHLNDIFSVIGERDRFNALNGGLKWRLYSR